MSAIATEDGVFDSLLVWLVAAVNPVGDPVDGMMGSLILIVATIAASFVSLGATLVLTFLFTFVFLYHLLRFIWQGVTG